jgi:hypothetical protein
VSSAPNSESPKFVRADCPPGKRVIGGGAIAEVPPSKTIPASFDYDARITQLRPDISGTFFEASASEAEEGLQDFWVLRVQVICADPLPGLEYVQAFSPTNSNSPHNAQAFCPEDKRVIGLGGLVSPSSEQLVLSGLRPAAGMTRVIAAGLEDSNGWSGNWHVSAIAICANPLPGLQTVSVNSFDIPNILTFHNARAQCPDGTQPISIGGRISGTKSQAYLSHLYVVPGFPSVAYGKKAVPIQDLNRWFLVNYTMCADG